MPGRGGDEVPALLSEQNGNRLGIIAAQRLASEDDHTCVDVLCLYAGRFVSIVDDCTKRGVVDALVARIGCQRHRRLKQGFPRHDIVPAGEILAVAAQVDAGKDDLRSEEHTSELQSHLNLVCRLLLEKKKKI